MFLLLLCMAPLPAFAALSEYDDNSTSVQIEKESQIYDPTPDCGQARKAFQSTLRKLLSKDPKCRSERLIVTFKKREMVRSQSLLILTKAGIDGRRVCQDWLADETKRLRSTFAFGSCRPPLPSARAAEFAAIGYVVSLPGREKLDIPPFESYYSRQIKAEGDQLAMRPTKKLLVAFDYFIKGFFAEPSQDMTDAARKICEDWRKGALKMFASELSAIDSCNASCSCRRSCSCFAASHMMFRSLVQAYTLYKSFDGSSAEQAIAHCESWLKDLQKFNSTGYVTGRCGDGGFSTYAKDGSWIYRSKGASYQFQPIGQAAK